MASNAEKLLRTAAGELGTRENPANSNNVRYNTWYYGHAVSGSGYPWCMVFVQWCFERIGCPLPYLTASCGALLNWYRNNDPDCIVAEPRPGDIVIFDFPGGAATDHAGILESAGASMLTTIDGNTGSDSAANGGAVLRRTRERKYAAAFIRPRSLWEQEALSRYNRIDELPDWARDTVRKLCDRGLLGGTGGASDRDGRPANLDLSLDMARLLVINDRAGVYGA